ncbi:hypothetical protein KSF_101390 [Reticulibacter mediterranei]|uniref:Uncharacterized protein n=1 Tax=Reticulibacter mediterranei TaxID=2778369 RepID=A0A8J3ISQ5_9CHLR|nr:hypothetical protein [Reticulibacter mediterranei]GHP00092.1 hypothetical protein KSF_101390 [Reticulibacter mediterranei]
MKQDVSEMSMASLLELLQRPSTQGDLPAWTAFQLGLEETTRMGRCPQDGSSAAHHLQATHKGTHPGIGAKRWIISRCYFGSAVTREASIHN